MMNANDRASEWGSDLESTIQMARVTLDGLFESGAIEVIGQHRQQFDSCWQQIMTILKPPVSTIEPQQRIKQIEEVIKTLDDIVQTPMFRVRKEDTVHFFNNWSQAMSFLSFVSESGG